MKNIQNLNKKEKRIGIAKGAWRDVSENEFNDLDMLKMMQGEDK